MHKCDRRSLVVSCRSDSLTGPAETLGRCSADRQRVKLTQNFRRGTLADVVGGSVGSEAADDDDAVRPIAYNWITPTVNVINDVRVYRTEDMTSAVVSVNVMLMRLVNLNTQSPFTWSLYNSIQYGIFICVMQASGIPYCQSTRRRCLSFFLYLCMCVCMSASLRP